MSAGSGEGLLLQLLLCTLLLPRTHLNQVTSRCDTTDFISPQCCKLQYHVLLMLVSPPASIADNMLILLQVLLE